jgi:hypothetical protein
LLLALASTVTLGSESHGTHDHILLSDGSGSLPDSLNFKPEVLVIFVAGLITPTAGKQMMTVHGEK